MVKKKIILNKDNRTITAFMQYVICCSCYGIRAKSSLRL